MCYISLRFTYLLTYWLVGAVLLSYLQELCVPVADVRGRPRLQPASTRCIHYSATDGEDAQRKRKPHYNFRINFSVSPNSGLSESLSESKN